MRQAVAILTTALFLGAWTAASAAEPAPQGPVFNIMGPSTCAAWPKSGRLESAAKAVPLNWILGFASGEALAADDLRLLDLVQPEKVDAWMTSYCAGHGSESLPVAGKAMVAELMSQLPPRPPPAPEPPMFVPPVEAPPPKVAPKKPPVRKPAVRKPAAKPALGPAK